MRIWYFSGDRGIPVDGTKGASAHLRGLVRAFLDLGHEVILIAPGGSPGDAERISRVLPGVSFQPIPTPRSTAAALERLEPPMARALGHLWNNPASDLALERALETGLPDLLYQRLSPFEMAGSAFARAHGLFHVLEVNAPLAWEGKQYRRQAFSEAAEILENDTLRSASLILTVSSELREALARTGIPAEKIVAIPNGVDTETFSPRGEAERDGLEGKFVVGFVGSLKPWHGIDVLAEAFDRLSSDSRYHLLVVGTGPEDRVVREMRERHPGRVTWRGSMPHEEVPRMLRAMDVAVAPYPALERFYFSPLKVLEYMATGRAIVASAIGQIPSLLENGRTALLVPPGDSAGLASAIEGLAADPDLRVRLGREAREESVRYHRWTDRASEILRCIQSRAEC